MKVHTNSQVSSLSLQNWSDLISVLKTSNFFFCEKSNDFEICFHYTLSEVIDVDIELTEVVAPEDGAPVQQ